MRGSAVAHFHHLALECADPTKAARAMLQTGEKHIKLTKRQITFNFLDRLQSKRLGTEDVERASKGLIRNKLVRDQGYIDYVMRRRWRDAREEERMRRLYLCGVK